MNAPSLRAFSVYCCSAAAAILLARAITLDFPAPEPFEYYNQKTPPLYSTTFGVSESKHPSLENDRSEKLMLRAGAGGTTALISMGHYHTFAATVKKDGDALEIPLSFEGSRGRLDNKEAKREIPVVFAANASEQRLSFDGKTLNIINMAAGEFQVHVMLAVQKADGKTLHQGKLQGDPQCDSWDKGCAIGVVVSDKAPAPAPGRVYRIIDNAGKIPVLPILALPLLALAWRRGGSEATRRLMAVAFPSLSRRLPIGAFPSRTTAFNPATPRKTLPGGHGA